MDELLIKDTVLQLRQNNVSNETNNNLKVIISEMSNLVSRWEQLNEADINEVICQIKDLLDAYQSGDIIYLADVLEYEILNLIDDGKQNRKLYIWKYI